MLSAYLGECRAAVGVFRGTTTHEADLSAMGQVGPPLGATDRTDRTNRTNRTNRTDRTDRTDRTHHALAGRRSHTSIAPEGKPSVNRAEAAKFAKLSSSWWDPNGPFKPLHNMNKARCEFIKGVIDEYVEERDGDGPHGTSKGDSGRSGAVGAVDRVDRRTDDTRQKRQKRIVRVLDVGCGGGILSEALATMPMRDPDVELQVLGIDVNQEGIDTAMEHQRAAHPGLSPPRLGYRAVTIEDLLDGGDGDDDARKVAGEGRSSSDAARNSFVGAFDVTIASEVIEHVDHPQEFCRNLVRATAPGGRIIVSTLNRTVKSYALAIVGAETLLRMVPEGTHDWSKFLTPEEVVLMMTEDGSPAALDAVAGMVLNPLSGLWKLEDNIDVNYIASFSLKLP